MWENLIDCPSSVTYHYSQTLPRLILLLRYHFQSHCSELSLNLLQWECIFMLVWHHICFEALNNLYFFNSHEFTRNTDLPNKTEDLSFFYTSVPWYNIGIIQAFKRWQWHISVQGSNSTPLAANGLNKIICLLVVFVEEIIWKACERM